VPDLSCVTVQAEQAMSIEYNTRVYEMQQRGQKVLVMSLGEAFFDIPLYPMDDLPYPAVNHYSHSRGLSELRDKLCCYYFTEYHAHVDAEREIIVTAGSKAAIHMTLMSILNPGDEAIFTEPAWVSYPEQIKLCYGVPVSVPVETSVLDIEAFITPRTKAVIISNPHNPRGYVYSEEELLALLALAKKHNFWLLCDEAYSDFLLDGSFVSLASLDADKKYSVVFNSMSKNYGISGWRIGYVIGNEELMTSVLKVNQHLITCPATILEYYLARHFDELIAITKPQIRDLVYKRAQLASFMDEIGLEYLPGAATFYFFVSLGKSRLPSRDFCNRLLDEECISTVPGAGYGKTCDRFIRVSVGTASLEENMRGLRCIRSLIDKTT
jgi:aminotransferase